jgi:hypothetical protein
MFSIPMPDAVSSFGRIGAWVVSIGLLVMGMASLLAAASLIRPATNPMSMAAPRFQVSMLFGTLLAAFLLLLSEVAARRWAAPAGGWRWGWFLIAAPFLLLGVPLLLGGLGGSGSLHRRTVGFRLGIGGIYVMFGLASVRAALAGMRRRS